MKHLRTATICQKNYPGWAIGPNGPLLKLELIILIQQNQPAIYHYLQFICHYWPWMNAINHYQPFSQPFYPPSYQPFHQPFYQPLLAILSHEPLVLCSPPEREPPRREVQAFAASAAARGNWDSGGHHGFKKSGSAFLIVMAMGQY